MTDMLALADKEKSLKTLENENKHLKVELENAKEDFTTQVNKISNLMDKSEGRFKLHESKYLLEIDRHRQKVLSTQKDLQKLSSMLKNVQIAHDKEVAGLNKSNVLLSHRIGLLEGRIQSLNHDKTVLAKQLKKS
jgi:hypothetical protein